MVGIAIIVAEPNIGAMRLVVEVLGILLQQPFGRIDGGSSFRCDGMGEIELIEASPDTLVFVGAMSRFLDR